MSRINVWYDSKCFSAHRYLQYERTLSAWTCLIVCTHLQHRYVHWPRTTSVTKVTQFCSFFFFASFPGFLLRPCQTYNVQQTNCIATFLDRDVHVSKAWTRENSISSTENVSYWNASNASSAQNYQLAGFVLYRVRLFMDFWKTLRSKNAWNTHNMQKYMKYPKYRILYNI